MRFACTASFPIFASFLLLFIGQNANAEPSSIGTYDGTVYLIGDGFAEQDGKMGPGFAPDKPILITLHLVHPPIKVPAGVPINLLVYDPNHNLIDNVTLAAIHDKIYPDKPVSVTYSFTAHKLGDYLILANGSYDMLSSKDYRIPLKVRPSPYYTFEVEGKNATATVDMHSTLKFVRSVTLDTKEKKLSITTDKEDQNISFEVDVPYALLSDPYVIQAGGNTIETRIGRDYSMPGAAYVYKDGDHARIRIPVIGGATHFDIIGSTVIPEFDSLSMLVMSLGIVGTIVAAKTMQNKSRS